jgi:hypothetical protein
MYKFKVGDKVRYNAANREYAAINGHDSEAIYPVRGGDDEIVLLGEDPPFGGVFDFRLELVEAAVKPQKKEKPQGNFAWGILDKETGAFIAAYPTRRFARRVGGTALNRTVKKIQYTIVK